MKSKQVQFTDLIARVQNCSLCPRMSQRSPVLSPSNGNLNALVGFIAEAPGRLGADKFGIPLFGDQTGRNFEWLISNAGINREAIFITNAVLCNPREADGKNDSPTMTEIRNCSIYLKETLEIVRPKYIVPLGSVALASLNVIESHNIRLSQGVGKLFPWSRYLVFPLFHPGPRAFIWRPKTQQVVDYEVVRHLMGEAGYATLC